jgi:glycine/D-amino acid oxidase-like deaminating enzyme
MSIERRDFLKGVATAGAGIALTGTVASAEPRAPLVRSGQAPDVAVVGAGAFGAWTALYLQRMGARVTLVDQRGPANSRATSGGETRGVRSSYGDRPHGLQWGRWAVEAMARWKAWDEEHIDELLPPVYFTTGDVIMREEMEPFLERTMENWDAMGREYEVLTPEEVRRRWPAIRTPDVGVALYEPGAGVVRARRAIESVAQVYLHEGGELRIGRVQPLASEDARIDGLVLENGDTVRADQYVFALGPWLPRFFPERLGRRVRIRTLGHVYYVSTPPGDMRYQHPNLPSYNVPGVTGWPALPRDFRGFRIRTGGHRGDDPDTSVRWIDAEYHDRPREVLARYFPELAERPFNETRACHYCGTPSRNFIIDHHGGIENAWIAGGGNAEAFKQGPVLGEFVASRVLGAIPDDDELAQSFRVPEEEYEVEGGDDG